MLNPILGDPGAASGDDRMFVVKVYYRNFYIGGARRLIRRFTPFPAVNNPAIERRGKCEREQAEKQLDIELTDKDSAATEKQSSADGPPTLPPYPLLFKGEAAFVSPSNYRENAFLFIIVTSSAKNFEARKAIRSSWGYHAANSSFQVIFVVGFDEVNDKRVDKEAGSYGDMLCGSFLDTYLQNERHTLKTLLGMKWAISAGNPEYILKVNSESFVNVYGTIKWLQSLRYDKNMDILKDLYAGHCHNGVAVVRNPQSPFFVPEDQWSDVSFPVYSSGVGIVLSRDVTEKMVRLAPQIKMVHIDDVFLGVMAQNLSIKCLDFSNRFDTAYTTMLTECDDLNFCVLGGVPAKDMFYLNQNVDNLRDICIRPSEEK
ncbi:beta-1,3-galactosyltransferase 1-like [Montipora capricornis]|uniref:beta-1,3-galactosyltransferase 1-like n=1 Tax=Montipora capricornis TaxID=246305 RepID=UPI0035F12732